MLNCKSKLCVIYDDGLSPVDISSEMQDFAAQDVVVDLQDGKYVYFGIEKPIGYLYAHLALGAVMPTQISVEYYDGSIWSPVDLCDGTADLTKSGLLDWPNSDDMQSFTILGKTQCFYRLKSDSVVQLDVTLRALGLIFSDDSDIEIEATGLTQDCYYSPGQTSHVLAHVAARDYIMSRLRSLGYIKTDKSGGENITEWDVLEISELRQASLYYAMSHLYFNLSDSVDDHFWAKYLEYKRLFEEAFSLGSLRIDLDGDGELGKNEGGAIKSVRWIR